MKKAIPLPFRLNNGTNSNKNCYRNWLKSPAELNNALANCAVKITRPY